MLCFLLFFVGSQGHLSLTSRPPLPEEGPLVAEIASFELEAPETVENQGGDGFEGSLEGSMSTQSPPLAEFEEQDVGRKRKHQEDLISLGSSKLKDVPEDQSTSKKPHASLYDFLESDS
jgi:hypothetical protein